MLQLELAEDLEELESAMRLTEETHRDLDAGVLLLERAVYSIPQRWPSRWDAAPIKRRPFSFHGFVTLKDGEYFFPPSIQFLRTL
jgi:hypothetical protein